LLLQRLHRDRVGDPVRPDPGTPERGQVPPDAQGCAEVAGEGADVGAGGALHVYVDVEDRPAGSAYVVGGELADGHRAWRQVDPLPRAGALVRALALDLDR